ncbi:hypothetical protein BVRB_6g144200 [Beta vulgaris subsp. vulgaris]|nr:hypothetical protein BVRB_6g144200 [Beta vulgaris subsp. vulgaris]
MAAATTASTNAYQRREKHGTGEGTTTAPTTTLTAATARQHTHQWRGNGGIPANLRCRRAEERDTNEVGTSWERV